MAEIVSSTSDAATKKPVLACDIDEVLAHFAQSLALFHNHSYNTAFTADDFHSYDFHLVWGGTVDECNEKMELYFLSDHFQNQLYPISQAFECLKRLGEHFDLQVVTARQNKLKGITVDWINLYFPGIFSQLHFGNHYSTEGKKRSKSEMCREIGAFALIDDSFAYAKDCAMSGIPTILFGDYAWNRSFDVAPFNATEEMIIRVRNWDEAVEAVHQLSVRTTSRQ